MSVEGLINVGVPVEALVRAVRRHPDHRVLTRIRPLDRREAHGFRTGVLRGVCLDVETTGLDADADQILELAAQSFYADAEGRIVSTGRPMSWLEDPGVDISAEITAVTGLRKEHVKGRAISEGEASALIGTADIVIAHNSRFDRPFVERRLPYVAGRPWGCSLQDVDWRTLGFEGRSLTPLLMQMGWFYEAHRAEVDVCALLHLLDHQLPGGETVLKHLLDRARQPTWIVEMRDAHRDRSEILKARGYQWDAGRSAWCRTVADGEVDREVEWGTVHAYHARRSPDAIRQDWTTRYAAL